MTNLYWLKHLADYLAGAEDNPTPGLRLPQASWLWGLWWGVLTALIILFSGQATKFIYIDF